jgi:hypothetical protein
MRKKPKKIELSDIISRENSSLSNPNNKRSLREKKPTTIEDLGYIDKDMRKKGKNHALQDVYKKCERVLQKLRRSPNADFYSSSSNEEVPTLSQMERRVKSFYYSTFYQFSLDLRKIWNYYFSNFSSSPEIYQRTLSMSEFSEELLKESDTDGDKTEIRELEKKVENLSSAIRRINQTQSVPAPKKVDKGGPSDKPMTMQEKNLLGNSIRSLPPDQLKGIVNILSESLVIDPKKRFFEFDIETLDNRKLRELEKYVKNCTKKNTTTTKPARPVSGDLTENEKIAQLKVGLLSYVERPSPKYIKYPCRASSSKEA